MAATVSAACSIARPSLRKKTALALSLLGARPVQAGAYRVVLNPRLAGVFTHEAFGHFSEADLIEDSPTMRAQDGARSAAGHRNPEHQGRPDAAHQLGHYKYDDEGVPARPTQLMKDGVLVGRLHSRRTAAAYGEPVSGHSVAEDFRFAPIIRMGCIFIEPGRSSLEDLCATLGDGLYLAKPDGRPDRRGELHVRRAIRLPGQERQADRHDSRHQYLRQSVRDPQGISAIGNDLLLAETGGCGKGQLNVRSCHGAPHVMVDRVVIGGV